MGSNPVVPSAVPRHSWVGLSAPVLLLLLCGHAAAQQSGTIQGRVLTDDDRPVEGATVRLGDERRTLSSESGAFEFTDVRADGRSLRVDYLGFETARKRIRLDPGETRSISFSLDRDAVEVADLVVEVPRRRRTWVRSTFDGLIRRHGTLVTEREIADWNPYRTSDLLQRFADIQIRGLNEAGIGNRVVVRCHGRLREPTVYLDGAVMPDLDVDAIPPEQIAALGVVTGPSVSALSPSCGAVVILTKGMIG